MLMQWFHASVVTFLQVDTDKLATDSLRCVTSWCSLITHCVLVSHSTIAPGLEYDEGKLNCNQSNVFIRRSLLTPSTPCPALRLDQLCVPGTLFMTPYCTLIVSRTCSSTLNQMVLKKFSSRKISFLHPSPTEHRVHRCAGRPTNNESKAPLRRVVLRGRDSASARGACRSRRSDRSACSRR